MKYVHVMDIVLEYVFMLTFAACLVIGVFNWHYFIVSGAALFLYIVWGLIRLRCPWCGGGIEVGNLAKARRHGCHCPICGHEITVVWRVNRKYPQKGSEKSGDK